MKDRLSSKASDHPNSSAKKAAKALYRPNVAALIEGTDGRVLLGRKSGAGHYWQFPQGGVDGGEDPLEAMYREVYEEVGIARDDLELVEAFPKQRYEYPDDHSKRDQYLGQEQEIYFCRYAGDADRVRVDLSNEFEEARWFAPDVIKVEWFPPNKRDIARKVLNAFIWRHARSICLPQEYVLRHRFERSMETPVSNRYVVEPGSKLDLAKVDTRDKALFEGKKADSLPVFDALRDQLQLEQKKLFAQNKERVLVIIQAMDTGGKDGLIKHVFSRIDPQGVQVVAFKKPSEEELARDFLWRVHKHVPRNGMITIFNRSHYEDIIAVRVKQLFEDAVWQRRYQHVIDFEKMLAEEGTKIVKIFLHISKEEQRERLVSRLQDPNKHWKFHLDDLDDRARWDEFEGAYSDLITQTSTKYAPWHIIPADRKWYRNYAVARLMLEQLGPLDLSFPEVNFDPSEIVVED